MGYIVTGAVISVITSCLCGFSTKLNVKFRRRRLHQQLTLRFLAWRVDGTVSVCRRQKPDASVIWQQHR